MWFGFFGRRGKHSVYFENQRYTVLNKSTKSGEKRRKLVERYTGGAHRQPNRRPVGEIDRADNDRKTGAARARSRARSVAGRAVAGGEKERENTDRRISHARPNCRGKPIPRFTTVISIITTTSGVLRPDFWGGFNF